MMSGSHHPKRVRFFLLPDYFMPFALGAQYYDAVPFFEKGCLFFSRFLFGFYD